MAFSEDLLAQRNKLQKEILSLESTLSSGSNIADLLSSGSDSGESNMISLRWHAMYGITHTYMSFLPSGSWGVWWQWTRRGECCTYNYVQDFPINEECCSSSHAQLCILLSLVGTQGPGSRATANTKRDRRVGAKTRCRRGSGWCPDRWMCAQP